jgi:two-component system chemotaxis sensor kinase CheA
MVNDADEEIIQAFLEESRENLDQLDRDLVELEQRPSDPQLLSQVFRTIHTIKGTCGFLGFHHVEALTHAGENLLGALREGELGLDAPITTSLLGLVDAVRRTLELIDRTGTEGDDDHAAVIAGLRRHRAAPLDLELAEEQAAAPTLAAEVRAAPETTVRVDVTVLDKLMDLVGELVLARSQFGESATTGDDGELSLPYRQLRIVTSELQEGVMQARLQPVGTVTGRLRRVVRDLAAAMGKEVGIEIDGEDIGVDKAVNEALRDPLLHLVRNAVDHGIELPEERLAAGKPARGSLTLRAFQAGGRVHIELADDGRGIDAGRVVAKAIATGVVSHDDGVALTPDEVLDLMFRPGLSTKEEVTHISGRGVGLDVVRSALQHVGGSIDVSSEPGRGAVFRLTVPLTLAIMPVLIASVGAERYAVPQVDVQEVVYLSADEMASALHHVDDALVLRLRDRLLPLVDLADQLHLEPDRDGGGLTVIVVETAGRRFGIAVGGVGDATDAVVKPLTRATRSIRLFGGVTILSDGRPSLILDVGGLASSTGITATPFVDTDDRRVESQDLAATLLLASGADGGRLAVEMAVVRRLEQIPVGSVQRSGPLEVVHNNGGIVPLIRVADLLPNGSTPSAPTDLLDAVVCESSIGLVGLVVGHIEDVVARPAATPQPPSRRGVAARVVVDHRVTEVLDVETLVVAAGLGGTG